MDKTVAIIQSSYIPWKGYFDIIGMSDLFLFLDDVQFTRRDWRNRNCIKGPNGVQWLTIPVKSKGRYTQTIEETEIVDSSWAEKHWKSIVLCYGRAPYFAPMAPRVEALYAEAARETRLSLINARLTRGLSALLGIATPFDWSSSYPHEGDKSQRLLSLCQAVGATRYLSGPSAAGYLDVDLFADAGIDVAFMDYSDYPAYPQRHGAFVESVSVLDLLFNVGPEARHYMKWPVGRGA